MSSEGVNVSNSELEGPLQTSGYPQLEGMVAQYRQNKTHNCPAGKWVNSIYPCSDMFPMFNTSGYFVGLRTIDSFEGPNVPVTKENFASLLAFMVDKNQVNVGER